MSDITELERRINRLEIDGDLRTLRLTQVEKRLDVIEQKFSAIVSLLNHHERKIEDAHDAHLHDRMP